MEIRGTALSPANCIFNGPHARYRADAGTNAIAAADPDPVPAELGGKGEGKWDSSGREEHLKRKRRCKDDAFFFGSV